MKAFFGLFWIVVFLWTTAALGGRPPQKGGEQTTTPAISALGEQEQTTPAISMVSSYEATTSANSTNSTESLRVKYDWEELDYYDVSDDIDYFFKGPVCDEFYSDGINFNDDMKFYENCIYIHGSLTFYMSISSITNKTQEYFDNISFPAIRQVSGFVIIYDTYGFTSLEKLFPNLAVIGGNTLYYNKYSLVVMQNKHLKRLGLKNLAHIRNGAIRIQNNPSLCHLSTIDWGQIGSFDANFIDQQALIMFNKDGACLDMCLPECNGHCWGYDICQKPGCPKECENACAENAETCHCHAQCLGGCSIPNDPNACFGCKDKVNLNGTCVGECGAEEYISDVGSICMDLERCINTYGILFEHQCVQRCPSGYKKGSLPPPPSPTGGNTTTTTVPYYNDGPPTCIKCPSWERCPITCGENQIAADISDLQMASKWRNCEVIVPRLEIMIKADDDDETYEKLEEYFGNIYQLSTLVVRQTNLQSLKFFKKLKIITGDHEFIYKEGNKSYSVYLNDNKVLDELWFGKADGTGSLAKAMDTQITGYTFFHFNPHLCNNVIDYVRNASTGVEDNDDISDMTNSPACLNIWMDIWVTGTMMASGVGEAYAWFNWLDPDIPIQHNFGYILYYKISTSQNATRLRRDETDTCGSSRWKTMMVQSTDHGVQAHELRPNTQYAYYIKCKVPPTTNTKVESPIQYFTTSVAIPHAPDFFRARALDKSTVHISWMTPTILTGPFKHYRIRIVRLCEDTEHIVNRFRSCEPHGVDDQKKEPEPPVETPEQAKYLEDALKRCQKIEIEMTRTRALYKMKERKDMKLFEHHLADTMYPAYNYEDGQAELDEQKKRSFMAGKGVESRGKQRSRRGIFGSEDSEEYDPKEAPDYTRPRPGDTIQGHSARYRHARILVDNKKTAIDYAIEVAKNKRAGRNLTIEYTISDELGSSPYLTVLTNYPQVLDVACANRSAWNETCDDETFELRVNTTEVTVTGLCHYTDYRITLMTCVFDPANNKTYCTDSMSSSVTTTRTKPDYQADQIENLQTEINKTNTNIVMVKFDPPKQPNGLIKYYNLIYKLQGSDKHGATSCCSAWEFNERNMCEFEVKGGGPGEYELQIQAISLLGLGNYGSVNLSPKVPFTIVSVKPKKHSLEHFVLGLAVMLSVIVVGVCIYIKKSQIDSGKRATYLMTVNPEYTSVGTYQPDAYEIPINRVSTSRRIGNGHFGEVYEGVAKEIVAGEAETKVAVKTLIGGSGNPLLREEFLKEANTMKTFNSYHVVRLLGVVSMTDKPMVIMEFMHYGDLKSYLRNSRPDAPEKDKIDPISYQHKLQMCCEIADGMAYLSDCKFVHRDLAARNCLINADLTVKVGDFGLTRDVYETDYYRIGSRGIMPVRWMSPESLKDGVFNSRSDVWSYGIVLWEIATLSEQPYQGKQHDQVTRYVIDGGYMERPKECPSERLYELMKHCWMYNPSNRPTFIEIVTLFANDANENFREHAYFYERHRRRQQANMEMMEEITPSEASEQDRQLQSGGDQLQEKDPLLLGNDVTNYPPIFLDNTDQPHYDDDDDDGGKLDGGGERLEEQFNNSHQGGVVELNHPHHRHPTDGGGNGVSYRKYTLENNPYSTPPQQFSDPTSHF